MVWTGDQGVRGMTTSREGRLKSDVGGAGLYSAAGKEVNISCSMELLSRGVPEWQTTVPESIYTKGGWPRMQPARGGEGIAS